MKNSKLSSVGSEQVSTLEELSQTSLAILQKFGVDQIGASMVSTAIANWKLGKDGVSAARFRSDHHRHRHQLQHLESSRILQVSDDRIVPTFSGYCVALAYRKREACALRRSMDFMIKRASALSKNDPDRNMVPWHEFIEPAREGLDRLSRAFALLAEGSGGISRGTLPDGQIVVTIHPNIREQGSIYSLAANLIRIHYGSRHPQAASGLNSRLTPLLNAEQLALSQEAHDEAVKALNSVLSAPSSAVRAARSTIEATLKFIASSRNIALEPGMSPAKMFRSCKASLALDRPESAELVRGLASVCESLSTIRNSLGDAHGRYPGQRVATRSEAQLAVGAAVLTSVFLLERMEAAIEIQPAPSSPESTED